MPHQGIADLSFKLSNEPLLGQYNLHVHSKKPVTHHFTVEEFVLPVFEVTHQFPKKILFTTTEITVSICGLYTYGKPVIGTVRGKLCRRSYRNSQEDYCHVVNATTDKNGCCIRHVPTSIFQLKQRRYLTASLSAEYTIVEQGTGVERSSQTEIDIHNLVTKLTFQNVKSYFRVGSPFIGKLWLLTGDGVRVSNATVYLFVSKGQVTTHRLQTDARGVAAFSLDTGDWGTNTVILKAIYKVSEPYSYSAMSFTRNHRDTTLSISPFHSRSGSYLSILGIQGGESECGKEREVVVEYSVAGGAREGETERENENIGINYLVMARGKIVLFDRVSLKLGRGKDTRGRVSFSLPITHSLAPLAKVFVFAILSEGELTADSTQFPVSKCLPNQVSLRFSHTPSLPGSQVQLHLRAEPDSLCALRVIDQSLLLYKPEEQLSADTIFGLGRAGGDGVDYRVRPPVICSDLGHRSYYYTSTKEATDVATILESLGLHIFTNLYHTLAVDCDELQILAYSTREMVGTRKMVGAGMNNQNSPPQIRKFFPETWIWKLVSVGPSGEASLASVSPDTLTEWRGQMFCTSPQGLGLSSIASFTTFKPFFVSLTLPHSAVRGETLTLTARVANYHTTCLMINVTLIDSLVFLVEKCHFCHYISCVCPSKAKTFTWKLTATALGTHPVQVSAVSVSSGTLCGNDVVTVPERGASDQLINTIIVKPEGTEKELTSSSFLCPDEKSVSETFDLQIPEKMVQGSERGIITVIGDILGAAMDNLDGLLKLPTGCGEQNMVKFAPNIYTLNYLQLTGQITHTIHKKALTFLNTGYQRQLNYKHSDGSYSAFGKHDIEGNTWLTAFVLRSFVDARPHIFVDVGSVEAAVRYLSLSQDADGCFQSRGQLFNNDMKGGVDDRISLSAYVTTSLLQYSKGQNKPLDVVENALNCLRNASESVKSVYTLALLSYTFTLSDHSEEREKLIERLNKLANTTGGMTHWEAGGEREEDAGDLLWVRAPSAQVEITAYTLLTHLSSRTLTTAQLMSVTPIIKWLIRQRNPYGGFSSTQDTVIALQALSLYASLTHSLDSQNLISVLSEGRKIRDLSIDASNRLILHSISGLEVPGVYTVMAQGSGCVLVQASLKFNVVPDGSYKAFEISASLNNYLLSDKEVGNEKMENKTQCCRLNVDLRFTGNRLASNMVIVEIPLLSGYNTQTNYLPQPQPLADVKRHERDGDKIILYLEQLQKGELAKLELRVRKEINVDGIQPGFIQVYDYYKTEDSAVAQYTEPEQWK